MYISDSKSFKGPKIIVGKLLFIKNQNHKTTKKTTFFQFIPNINYILNYLNTQSSLITMKTFHNKFIIHKYYNIIKCYIGFRYRLILTIY